MQRKNAAGTVLLMALAELIHFHSKDNHAACSDAGIARYEFVMHICAGMGAFMRIEELTPGQSITIVANIGEEQLQFSSQIEDVYPRKHLVLATPVFQDDKVITFHANGLIVDILLTPEDDKPQIFKNVKVTLMRKKEGGLCYNLSTIAESKPFNRRKYFRCFVGAASSVQYAPTKATRQVIIKDISENGFSFICEADADFALHQVVHTVLNDYVEDMTERFNFHLYGIIVRRHEMDDHRVLYGCRLNNHIAGLETYIMKKERIRLKNTSGWLNDYKKNYNKLPEVTPD